MGCRGWAAIVRLLVPWTLSTIRLSGLNHRRSYRALVHSHRHGYGSVFGDSEAAGVPDQPTQRVILRKRAFNELNVVPIATVNVYNIAPVTQCGAYSSIGFSPL